MSARPPARADTARGDAPERDPPPPILGSWRALYAVVIGELLAIILACGWLTRHGR
jgi:hypothetical protein